MATFRKRRGRWQVMIRRRGSPAVSATFDTKAAAERWSRRIEGEIDQGRASGTGRITGTVGDLLKKYELEARKVRPLRRSALGAIAMLDAGLGKVELRRLTADDVLAHARKRAEAGAGPVTVSLELSRLRTALRASRALLGVSLDDKPVLEARIALRDAGLAGRARERDRLPTADELARLRAELARRSKLPLADMMDFARITAMRREEVCRLRWADLDEQAGTILIRDRKDPRRKEGNHQRVPLVFGSLGIVLRQPRGELIFPVRAETVSSVFPRACRACGIVGLRWHDLRHAAITAMFAAGMGLEEVALVSGHRTWAMLRRYTHLRAEDLARKYRVPPSPATPQGFPDGTGSSGAT